MSAAGSWQQLRQLGNEKVEEEQAPVTSTPPGPDFIVQHGVESSPLTSSSTTTQSAVTASSMASSNLTLWMPSWDVNITNTELINATLDASAEQDEEDAYGWYTKQWPLLKQTLTMTVVLSIAYILVLFLGIVNNALVVSLIYRNPQMRTVTNYFIANLAVADILVSILVLPITLLSNIFTGECALVLFQ